MSVGGRCLVMEGPPNGVPTQRGGIHGDPVTTQPPAGLQVLGERRKEQGDMDPPAPKPPKHQNPIACNQGPEEPAR